MLRIMLLVGGLGGLCGTAAGEATLNGTTRLGGAGGVYFLVSPGAFIVEVEKQDRHRRDQPCELRAILFGPDRSVEASATIPDDKRPRGSGLGPPQTIRLSTHVKHKGVYGLNITVSQDRYGDHALWGFRTNCPYFVIETSRGHRDERRKEPIVLDAPDQAGDICFLPPSRAFDIEISNLATDVGAIPVYNQNDEVVQTMEANDSGHAACSLPADERRGDDLWRLHLPKRKATVEIDGVTRWDAADTFPNLPCWTPDPDAFFPLLNYRWLITPYRRVVYGDPGEPRQIAYRVHNNSRRPQAIDLQLEFPQSKWPVELSTRHIELGAKKSADVTVAFSVPANGEERICYLRATPARDPEFSTYATLIARKGTAPASQPLEMPIHLVPYQHENSLFGYLPDYPVENQVYFDLDNRPSVRTATGISTLRPDGWSDSDLGESVQERIPPFEGGFGRSSSKIAFDRDNDLYILSTAGAQALLLHSSDAGKSFTAYQIPSAKRGPQVFDMEQFSGHNVPAGPPPLVRYTRTATDSRLKWRRVNDLELILAKKINGRLEFEDPVLISERCIGLSTHSGIPATVISREDKVHVVWGEATDPEERVAGVPTFVATYDSRTGKLGEPELVGYGPPANDVHNTPSVTMDSRGILHVLAGTHGQPFPYARSLQPNTAHGGWTGSVPVSDGLRQTYIGLVCGADDTLHLVSRLWRYGEEPHPASYHAVLAHQRKPVDGPWEPPRALVVPPFSEYSIFYHRLTVDRLGRLFLSYDYWSTFWFYRTDHPGDRRALLMSADGGQTWEFARFNRE